jgi:hypothetical protein
VTRPGKVRRRLTVMERLIAAICFVFWRIFFPLALVVAIGVGLSVLYIVYEDNGSEHDRITATQEVQAKIANTKNWEVQTEADPASGQEIPRYASVLSDDGLCRLEVEQRIDTTRLTGIYCSGLSFSVYQDNIQIKFDNRSTSRAMAIQRFSTTDFMYIPSDQEGQLSYDEFLRKLAGANKVAMLIIFEGAGQQWVTFSLKGSGSALMKIGALNSKPRN